MTTTVSGGNGSGGGGDGGEGVVGEGGGGDGGVSEEGWRWREKGGVVLVGRSGVCGITTCILAITLAWRTS